MSPPPPDAAVASPNWKPSVVVAPEAPPRQSLRAGRLWLKSLMRALGPGYLVAVGYMDPGNWATSVAGGSAYGYSLLWVVALSGAMAMFLQVLAARLGVVSGLDLAQAGRKHSSPRTVIWQWLACEAAICACDLAEVIGTAIALKLLFGIPLAVGVCLTVFDVLLILWLQNRGFRYLEALVLALLAVVAVCFGVNLVLASPVFHDVAMGFLPTSRTVTDPGMLYIAIGIIGATVMPHNLYLHSSVVQSRTRGPNATDGEKRKALTFATIDIVLALTVALVINAAILITAGATFHAHGLHEVTELQDAWKLLGPLTGTTIAGVLFAMALLASGQSSTLTATLAGQIVMEGFVKLRMPAWGRRLLTRSIAVVPALCVTMMSGDGGIARLLLLSQVLLSLQLPFAIVPLIRFTSSRGIMGTFANSRATIIAASVVAVIIIALDIELIRKALS